MNLFEKIMYWWHFYKYRDYEGLINDCLCEKLRNKLIIKAEYHRNLAKYYSASTVQTIE